MLIINADDLGLDKQTTDRIVFCYRHGKIQSASAMTFMKDSERAADLAKKYNLIVKLHLNFSQEFTAKAVNNILKIHHMAISDYLNARKINQVLFNPLLRHSFDYVFHAQWEEFCRLYGEEPTRLDGHHHMHLCMNMLASGRLPKGIKIRRNFTFGPGEKDPLNRLYRHLVDRWLTSRFFCTDFFFSMAPINQGRLKRLVLMSKSSDLEIMVHPGVKEEYLYLLSLEWASLISASSPLSL